MVSKILSKLVIVLKNKIFRNTSYLGIVQIANYLIPLIVYPYIIRILGIENFGILEIGRAFANYFITATDYGFNLSATKDIAININDKSAISTIFWNVVNAKLILLLLSFLILFTLTSSISSFNANQYIIYIFFLMVIGASLFPIWYFQGIEEMHYIAIISVTSKILTLGPIFIFVKNEADIFLAAFFLVSGNILASILSIIIILKKKAISKYCFNTTGIKGELIKGWNIFLSRIVTSLYSQTNIIILALFTNNTLVGYFAASYKIYNALSSLFGPLTAAIYPNLSKLFSTSRLLFYKRSQKVSILMFVFSSLTGFFVYFFSDIIMGLMIGNKSQEAVLVLRILSVAIVFVPFGSFFTSLLVIENKSELLLRILLFGGVVNFVLLLIILPLFNIYGMATVISVVQFILSILMYYYVFIKKGRLCAV